MRKMLMLALCLCLLFCMSVAASAATGELIDVSGESSEATTPESEKEIKYTITIAAPRGWYTKSAAVTVKFEDANGVGFDKAEAKLGQNGAWQDISDGLRSYGQAQIDISDNGTIYVAVTDKKGKAHVKSLYIECFDREAPTVRAKVDGRTLRVEADDALSGVGTIYVNGYSFDDLTNGTLDIRLKDYTETDEQDVFVYAVDFAGNRSKTVSVKNPYYSPPSSSKPETSQPATTPPASTTAPVSQAPASSQPAASAPAASQPATSTPPKVEAPKQEMEQAAASGDTDNGSVTPTDGTGTVIENSVKTPDQREFFTISTEAGNDYYIVVDKQKSDKNVYLLSEVTEDDLTGLAKKSGSTTEIPPVEPLPEVKPAPEPEPETVPEPAEPEPAPPANSDTGMYVTILILALAFGGGVYYFKIVRPKKNAAYADEDEGMDDDMDGDGDEDEYPEYPDDGLYFPGDFPESDFESGAGEDYRQPGEESGE